MKIIIYAIAAVMIVDYKSNLNAAKLLNSSEKRIRKRVRIIARIRRITNQINANHTKPQIIDTRYLIIDLPDIILLVNVTYPNLKM